ncbi:hypothetical protein Mp_2g19640 [Marchantia polymorpha subsp. ruderalis]|uniref:DUF4371 domain-containing protein n=1 Tax=Marchantia polymorpha TaxID=3197 RepID=A0A2R6WVG8_MARPO|nr:hypothetical protein MARPO_0055s0087 [Marchantia polymorpha]BBN02960.1 hypothetical protein Mp_2g19640 [Marchantia polymorpha subsp. ruderalis]|eukprot:PTQ37830.1 hypothetical protein MARPO_0055s0087 [Marchantia polymorpha]
MMFLTKRTTPFQEKHCIQFGLEIAGRDIKKLVICVQCRFCVHFGRDGDDVGRKRARSNAICYFSPPYRPELYRKHLENQHSSEWAEYCRLPPDEQRVYFDKSKNTTMSSFCHSASDVLHFTIGKKTCEHNFVLTTIAEPIVNLIEDLFFHPDDDAADRDQESITKANAMKLFKRDEAVIEQHRRCTKNPKLSGISDHMMSQFVRVVVAVDLQFLSKILSRSDVWAFLIACDGYSHFGISSLDIRIRLSVEGVLYNFHLVLVPFYDRHTALNIFNLNVKVLDVLYSQWREKLLSVSNDGENTMTCRHGGLVTLLGKEAENHILRIWCPAHQIDLVIKGCTKRMDGGDFYKTAHAFSVHLRAQQNLATTMGGTKCPKDTTRWVAFDKLIKWILQHRVKLFNHIESRNSIQSPSKPWWIMATAVTSMFDTVAVTFAILQSRDLVLSQQQGEIDNLILRLCNSMCIRHEDIDKSFLEINQTDFYKLDAWWISIETIVGHVEDQGSWARDMFSSFTDDVKAATLGGIAKFAIELIIGLKKVRAEHDSNNNAFNEDAPPVMPAQLFRLRPRDFNRGVLDLFRIRLAKFWTAAQIEEVEADHRDLIKAYENEETVRRTIDRHDLKMMFNEAWDSLKDRFKTLRCFCSGLATAKPTRHRLNPIFRY